jgi:hypothetical protein
MWMSSRLLIAAGGTATDPAALPFGVRALIDAADEILVIAPSLPARLDWITSATDKSREQADERLHSVLGHLEEIGSEARGAIGSDDPIEAFGDAIRAFAPDHLLIVLRGRDRAGWQERGLLDGLQERFALPMTVFQVAG